MSLQVLTTPEADSQIREIENWWGRNRTASPNLFADELAATLDVLGHHRTSGARIGNPRYRTRVVSYSRELAITSTTFPGAIR